MARSVAPGITPYRRYGEPSSQTEARLRTYTVKARDTLTHIAFRFYGDLELYTLIADRNGIIDTRRLDPDWIGREIVIPDLPLEKGRYESE